VGGQRPSIEGFGKRGSGGLVYRAFRVRAGDICSGAA